MENPEFPPNSEVSKRVDEKNVERVTSGKTIRRKKSLWKQFRETFVAGDVKSAVRYTVLDVAIPETRDLILEVLQQGLERLFKGESYRRRSGSTIPQSGPYGNVAYNRMSRPSAFSSSQRAMSRIARSRHNFDEIILDSRTEAEEVIDRLFDLVSRYDTATVADLYDLVGLSSDHTDHKWGWTHLRGAGVSRTRDGYLLDLPEPEPIG